MEEHAKEELKLLEAQYPNQHEHLKNELRSFIFQLQTNHQDSEQLPENNNFSTHLAFFDTEGFSLLSSSFFYFVIMLRGLYGFEMFLSFFFETESTSLEELRKRSDYDLELGLADRVVIEKIDGSSKLETPKSVVVKHFSSRKNKRKDRVDLVLERAQVCLKKIKHLKTFLLPPS